jgi:HEAT repeat protein
MADLIQKIENGQIEEAVYLLDRLEQPAVENLVDAYDQSQNAQFRAGIVAVIARVRAPESVAALARLLQHEDVYLQLAAAQALGAIAGQDVVEPLIAALGDPIPDVRAAAVTALCQARDERAIEPLIAALQDPSPQVREAAAAGMGWIDPSRLVEPLIAALKDRSDKVRITAASILIQSGDERAFEPLLDALQSRDLAVIASLPEFYLPYGSDGDEAMWIQALNSYGTKSTAEFYLNSGNQRLAQAAKIWADENGYTIEAGTRPGDNFPAWGKAKQASDSDQ